MSSKPEAFALSWNRLECPLQVAGELLPHVEEFKYLLVLFMSQGRMEWDWCNIYSDVDAVPVCCDEESSA